jgi:hypothetical protein
MKEILADSDLDGNVVEAAPAGGIQSARTQSAARDVGAPASDGRLSAPAGCRPSQSGTLHAQKAAPVDGPTSKSRSLAQAEVLRALRRDFPDPLIELAQMARTLAADRPFDPPLDGQLDAWAKKWRLPELREVAELHVYYWAGTPAAADVLDLLAPPPPDLPLVLVRSNLAGYVDSSVTGIDPDWSPLVVWAEPLKQLDPSNPLDPVLAHPNDESLKAALARTRANYKARKKITTPVPRPRVLTQHATWYVHRVVAKRKFVEIATDPKLFGRKGGEIDTIKKGIRQFRKLLHSGS